MSMRSSPEPTVSAHQVRSTITQPLQQHKKVVCHDQCFRGRKCPALTVHHKPVTVFLVPILAWSQKVTDSIPVAYPRIAPTLQVRITYGR